MKHLLLFMLMTRCYGEWTPPASPDPSTILSEARADAAAKRFDDALAKHVWYHQNALVLQPSQYGVRLSFALSAWARLGEAYPPALEKLRQTRDETERTLRGESSRPEAFHEISAINRYLKQDSKTKELFLWLDANKPELARRVYGSAEPALIKAREFKLCGRYVDPDRSFELQLRRFSDTKLRAKDPRFGSQMQDFAEKSFINGTTTLVALLVLNDRKDEADRIIAEALKAWDDEKLKAELDKAKQGIVPAPWP